MKSLTVRIIDKSDYSICQHIVKNQQIIWDIAASETMPFWKLMALPSIGGFLVGAFDGDTIVGHAMLSPAIHPKHREYFFYLDMIGVLPDYRNRGLAERMLNAARDCALDRQISSIQWTFDPLETANANLYIRKLGAQVTHFYPDYYGPPFNGNAALKSDRFWVRWDFSPPENDTTIPPHIVTFNDPIQNVDAHRLAIELPAHFAELRTRSPHSAVEWRRHLCSVFTALFQNGFKISAFVRLNEKNYYIATKS